MIKTWDDLEFWGSGDWGNLDERLGKVSELCPRRELVFNALDLTPFDSVRVGIFGQDPYPNPALATGVAFSVPVRTKKLPPTLLNLIDEYERDLHHTAPNGNLEKWCSNGILLWNVIPTCQSWKSLSHQDWEEWHSLTTEIIKEVAAKDDTALIFLGGVARQWAKFSDPSKTIEASHPSPRGSISGKAPFKGSRIFSRANAILKEPVDWRL